MLQNLTVEEVHELWRISLMNYRWKQRVREMWESGDYSIFRPQPLQSIRNKIGPSGLDKIKTEDLKPHVPLIDEQDQEAMEELQSIAADFAEGTY